MVKNIFILLLLILLFNFSYNADYENSEICITVNPKEKKDCNSVGSDLYLGYQEIACCYVTYKLDSKVEKCVPVLKTFNGLSMYENQIKNMGASSISIDCSSNYLTLSILLILLILF